MARKPLLRPPLGLKSSAPAALLTLGLTLGAGSGCGDRNSNNPPATTTNGTSTTTTMGTASMGSTGEDRPFNCNGIFCSGHGECSIGMDGFAACSCDEGYKPDPTLTECLVDEDCVELRFLEDRCRQIINGAPAVGLFFAVDFCSGTAVTPSKLDEIGGIFTVFENGVNIMENVESNSTVIEKDVESYVTLVVDMSDSITQDATLLPALIAELRAMVTTLQPAANEPPVRVGVTIFGREIATWLPHTRDLAAVDASLAAIETDIATVQTTVNGMGTSLYDAVAEGLRQTQRIRELRDAVTLGGVLTTGTVVVITDGKDSSNGTLDTGAINATLNQVISIGISDEVDDADLTAIGRDGSFLAPTPADWTAAFGEIAQRVDEYPDRAYLLAYCSSTTQGDPTVEISLSTPAPLATASCNFSADLFATNPPQCTADLFLNECNGAQCGGLTACGSCATNECCANGQCQAPTTAELAMLSCNGESAVCAATGEICDVDFCEPPDSLGAPCGLGSCEPGVGYCDAGTCVPALPAGSLCDTANECQSLNCFQTNTDNPFDPRICQPPAEMFQECSGGEQGSAVCESGTYCTANNCQPKKRSIVSCSENRDCRSHSCFPFPGGDACSGSFACFWPWSQKSD